MTVMAKANGRRLETAQWPGHYTTDQLHRAHALMVALGRGKLVLTEPGVNCPQCHGLRGVAACDECGRGGKV